MTFIEKLNRAWTDNQSMLMVGLDPDPARLPLELASKPGAIYEFCKAIVDVTADYTCGIKPQIAYFAANRAEAALENILAYANEVAPHATTILDAKRGDIGATAKQYAIEAFERYKADSAIGRARRNASSACWR